jgi:hypothetical protein
MREDGRLAAVGSPDFPATLAARGLSLVGGAASGLIPHTVPGFAGDTQQVDVAGVRFPDGSVLGWFHITHVRRAGGVFGEWHGVVESLQVDRNVAHVTGRVTRGSALGVGDLTGAEVAFRISELRHDEFATWVPALRSGWTRLEAREAGWRGDLVVVG